ncbi:hypothetical protein XENTR_v10007189 [Xenopus tropicalis]|nr:hypothetical protein XENTR_v10007189 [Xenopus tropicalis]
MRHRLRDSANLVVAPVQLRRSVRGARLKAGKAMSPSREAPKEAESSSLCHIDVNISEKVAAGHTEECTELDIDGEGAAHWWHQHEVLGEEEQFAELFQQLVGSVDLTGTIDSSTPQADSKMAATSGRKAKGRCPDNKNAVAARLNRLRKKEYVRGLENQVTRLSEENKSLQYERKSLCSRVRDLEGEVHYLRAVLANDSALSLVLSRLTGLGGTRLSTSLFSEPHGSGGDHDYALPLTTGRSEQEANEGGGVCLHVDRDKLSVEFCAVCARSASSAGKMWFLAFLCSRS